MPRAPVSSGDEIPAGIRLRLSIAFVIVLIETTLEIAFVFGRDDYGPGGKALVGGMFALKVVFAWWVRRLSPGAVFGLLLFELTGVLVATGASFALELRILLVGCVIAVFGLVGSSLSAFPSPEIR